MTDETVSEDYEAPVERLRRRFGAEIDPEITLVSDSVLAMREAQAEGAKAQTSSGLLGRLGARTPRASRYRLDGEIARGGMGAILEVWDEDLRRRLAMKVALGSRGSGSSTRAADLDPRILARFLEEAQVTGQLDHPGIVPVHELGFDENGGVFFTMRLVRGRDLEHVFGQVAEGREGWSVTRALGVLLRACEALAFAHEKGVIHRDLKPANIMVGQFGEVYVMDWGLARVQGYADQHDLRPRKDRRETDSVALDPREEVSGEGGEGLYTMDGDVLGTPAYMPPEQARGEIDRLDARADVYSMGAMFYRLLSGSPPYIPIGRSLPSAKILADLIEGPPTPLNEVAPDVPGELVAICEKAMAREREERYADMQELGEDLRAFLENRVVRAYEAGAIAEARKWVRRNKPLALTAAAGILALVGGLISSLVLKARSDENAALAELRSGEAAASAFEAERQERITGLVNQFLNEDLLAAVRSEEKGREVTVREVLEEAARRLGSGRFRESPLVEAELRVTIASSFQSLGLDARALPHIERAVGLFRSELGERDLKTLFAMAGEAEIANNVSRYAESLEKFERVHSLYVDVLGVDAEETIAALLGVAEAHADLAQFDQALELYEAALEGALRAHGPNGLILYKTRAYLAETLAMLGELERAEEELVAALDVMRVDLGPRHWMTRSTTSELALVYQEQGRFDESEALLLGLIELTREVEGSDHRAVAHALGRLGTLYEEQGRFGKAKVSFEEGLEILQKLLPEDAPEVLTARGNLLVMLEREGQGAKALPLRRELLGDMRRVLGPKSPDSITALNNLAVLCRAQGLVDEAERLYREAVDLYDEVYGPDHPSSLMVRENLGGIFHERGDYKATTALLREVLDGRRRVLGDDHPDVAKTMYNLATVMRSSGDEEGAAALFTEVLALVLSTVGPNPTAAAAAMTLGRIQLKAEKFAEAAEFFGQCASIRRELGLNDADVGIALYNQGFALFRMRDYVAAAEVGADALALRRELLGSADEATMASLYSHTRALILTGRHAEAEPLAIEYHGLTERGRTRGHTDSDRSRGLLVELYETWGRPGDADAWR